jgi:hypothetical protein
MPGVICHFNTLGVFRPMVKLSIDVFIIIIRKRTA